MGKILLNCENEKEAQKLNDAEWAVSKSNIFAPWIIARPNGVRILKCVSKAEARKIVEEHELDRLLGVPIQQRQYYVEKFVLPIKW